MDKRHMLSLVAALGLAGASTAQAQSTPTPAQQMPPSSSSNPTDPSSASNPQQRDAAGTATAPNTTESPATEQSMNPGAASSPSQEESMRTAEAAGRGAPDAASGQVTGLEVISPSGEALGTVVDVVTEQSGAPAYVVISSQKGNTVMPYSAATSMVHDNAVVVDQSKLNNAPKVQQGVWKDASSKGWRKESDRYWAKSNSDSNNSKFSKKERG
jgi:hypothetical protein